MSHNYAQLFDEIEGRLDTNLRLLKSLGDASEPVWAQDIRRLLDVGRAQLIREQRAWDMGGLLAQWDAEVGPVVTTLEYGYGRASVSYETGSGISSVRRVEVVGGLEEALRAALAKAKE